MAQGEPARCRLAALLTVALLIGHAHSRSMPCQTSEDGCHAAVGTCNSTEGDNVWDHEVFENVTSFLLKDDLPYCLNVEAWETAVGSTVWVTMCHEEEMSKKRNREWLLQGTRLVNPVSGLCLDAEKGAAAVAGSFLQLRPCNATPAFTPTAWSFDASTGLIKSAAGMCVYIPRNQVPPPAPPPPPPPPPFNATASVAIGGAVVARTSPGFTSFNFDWHKDDEEAPKWERMSVTKIDFHNKALLTAAKAMSPARLRVGGSEGDKIVYDVRGTECAAAGTDPDFCLNMTRWAELVAFCDSTGIGLVFGLNAMNRVDGKHQANFTNIEAFLAHVAGQKQRVYGFEFGNELPHVDPVVDANDFVTLHGLLQKYWPDTSARPKLIGNDLNTDAGYVSAWLKVAGPVMDAITFHGYVGYGLDPKLAQEITTVKFLSGVWEKGAAIQAVQLKEAPHAEMWIGEVAAAWHSGRENVTNGFVSSFWYADSLGVLARHNFTGFCRQTLLGGSYGLLRRDNYNPNPDYYTALLFHTLLGDEALDVQVSANGSAAQGSSTLKSYAHCARHGKGIVALLINFDLAASYTVQLSGLSASEQAHREMYMLTAESVTSREMMLNGHVLRLQQDDSLPDLKPVVTTDGGPLVLPPASISYVQFPLAERCN